MELHLLRSYYSEGTNGELWCGKRIICHTIELPWLDNQRQVSCIPEGNYQLRKRFAEKFQWHLWLENVPNRQWILFHPANNALKELRGCIAPVFKLEGAGLGSQSKEATKKLTSLVFPALDKAEDVYLTISLKTPKY